MASIDIGISHNNNFVISKFFFVKLRRYATTKSSYHILNNLTFKNFVKRCFFDINNLSPKRQDCLECTVSTLFCSTARTISFYQINFTTLSVFVCTISEFARQCCAFQNTFSTSCLSCVSGSVSSTFGSYAFEY